MQICISVILVLGTFASFLMKRDFFPFSNYPMYSDIFEPKEFLEIKTVEFYNEQSEKIEVNFRRDFKPFWRASFHEAIFRDDNDEKSLNRVKLLVKNYNIKINSENILDKNKLVIKTARLVRLKLNWNQILLRRRAPDLSGIIKDAERTTLGEVIN